MTERQKEKQKTTYKILIKKQKKKSFVYRLITGNKKWVYFDNPKRKCSWTNPGMPSTSTAKPNIYQKKGATLHITRST